MDELIALLRAADADNELIALAEQFGRSNDDDSNAEPLTDDDLDQLLAGLVALGDDETLTNEVIAHAADAAVAVRAEQAERVERAEREEAERRDLLANLRGDTDSDDNDDPDGVEAPKAEADTDPTDNDSDADGDANGDSDAESGEDAPAAADTPEPVAAAAGPARRPAARRALRRRTPPEAQPRDTRPIPGFTITLGADIPGISAGTRAGTLRDVDRALARRAESFKRSTARHRENVHVATIHRDDLPPERRLVDDRGHALAPHEASERVNHVISRLVAAAHNGQRNSLVAAGGLCAPLTPIYDADVLGEPGRPVRDEALVTFQAARGGVVSTSPPTIAQASSAVDEWTVANDEAAANNDGDEGDVTKTVMRIECGDTRETEIAAITRRVVFGNLLARTYAEYVDAVSTATMIAHDRLAEQTLLTRMRALSTVTTLEAQQVSATVDTLDVIRRAIAGMRSRHRLGPTYPFRVILPSILRDVMKSDLSRRMPSGTLQENLAVSDALIARAFNEMGANVTWSPDLAVQSAQAAGALAAWPDQFQWLAYPEGTFLHLDSGILDLGTVRDSALNSVNDAELFAETFENVHMLGVESIAGTVSVCPSGAVTGTIDPADICGTAS